MKNKTFKIIWVISICHFAAREIMLKNKIIKLNKTLSRLDRNINSLSDNIDTLYSYSLTENENQNEILKKLDRMEVKFWSSIFSEKVYKKIIK